MLISKKKTLTAGDVALVRLPSGEEIIGRVKTNNETLGTLTVTHALRIMMQMTQQGAQATLMPFMVGADLEAEVTVYLSKLIVAPVEPAEGMTAEYRRQTSSIATPPGGLILP